MKKSFLIICTAFLSIGFGQNLVPNASMENNTGCPGETGETNRAKGWFSAEGSPDYHHVCTKGESIGAPDNIFGEQEPFHGNGYFGYVPYFGSPDWREFFGIKLSSPLVPGQTYKCKMMTSLADICSIGVDNLGIQFSMTSQVSMNNMAHVYTKTPITDQINWVEISGTFVADKAYEYIFIGNFFSDAKTTQAPSGNGTADWCYYYVDSVSVMPLKPLEPGEVSGFSGICKENKTELSWIISSDTKNTEFILESSGDGTNFTEQGVITKYRKDNKIFSYRFMDAAVPKRPLTYYRLKQKQQNGSYRYFDAIEVKCKTPRRRR